MNARLRGLVQEADHIGVGEIVELEIDRGFLALARVLDLRLHELDHPLAKRKRRDHEVFERGYPIVVLKEVEYGVDFARQSAIGREQAVIRVQLAGILVQVPGYRETRSVRSFLSPDAKSGRSSRGLRSGSLPPAGSRPDLRS